jgi:16S rRNA (guanine527-N7)-methyltransferase
MFNNYLNLLQQWNKIYNLTAVCDAQSLMTRHINDSLAILPWIMGTRILDVGSGAGLPGIPLALINKTLQVVLIDSNRKKIAFLTEAKRLLQLENLKIIKGRVENYNSHEKFDTIVSRAFSKIPKFLKLTQHLLHENGIWLAMKGHVPLVELNDIKYHKYNYSNQN